MPIRAKRFKLYVLPLSQAMSVTAIIKPKIYPPVGPNNLAGPAVPPVNTGIPIRPTKI